MNPSTFIFQIFFFTFDSYIWPLVENNQKISPSFIALLQKKDKRAFEELYDSYSAVLLGIAFKITKDQDLADDVLQESFVKIWKHIESFDPQKATIFTWMLNITRNTAIDCIRKKSYQSNIQIGTDKVSIVDRTSSDTININTIGVRELIDGLKPEYKEVIDAVYFGDLTHEEASEKLELPLGTLKTRVRNALKELKTIFRKE